MIQTLLLISRWIGQAHDLWRAKTARRRPLAADNVTWRMETFCYGPKECSVYKAGPKRKVPGRQGMVYEDDGVSEPKT